MPPLAQQLQSEPWFHGLLSRKMAEKLLSKDGDFLVRESGTTPGQYVLTGQQGGQPKHLLLVDPEGVVRIKKTKDGHVVARRGSGLRSEEVVIDEVLFGYLLFKTDTM